LMKRPNTKGIKPTTSEKRKTVAQKPGVGKSL